MGDGSFTKGNETVDQTKQGVKTEMWRGGDLFWCLQQGNYVRECWDSLVSIWC